MVPKHTNWVVFSALSPPVYGMHRVLLASALIIAAGGSTEAGLTCRYTSVMMMVMMMMMMMTTTTTATIMAEWPPATCGISVNNYKTAANLTCLFPRDVDTILSDIYVQRFNVTAVRSDDLAVCKRHGDSHDCTALDSGVRVYDSNINGTKNFTLGLSPSDVMAAPGDYLYLCHRSKAAIAPTFCTFPLIAAPGRPVLQMTQTTSSSIDVSWDCAYDGGSPLQGYQLNYTKEGEQWRSVALKPDNTTFSATGLDCGTLYHFVVRAWNDAGYSSDSQVTDIRTNGTVPVMSSACQTLKEINSTAVTLDFIGLNDVGSCPIRFFSVKYRRRGDETWRLAGDNISSDIAELKVTDLAPDSKYTMTVTGHSQAGDTTCQLNFVTLPTPLPPDRDREEGGGGRSEDGGMRVWMIILVIALTVTVLVIVLLTALLLSIRARRRGRQDGSPLNDTEMESTPDVDAPAFQNALSPEQEPFEPNQN